MLEPAAGFEPEIGRWISGLEEVRRRTLHAIAGVPRPVLEWRGPDGSENSIGSLLYHIAVIEMNWLFMDILLEPMPPEIKALCPCPAADANRALTDPRGEPLDIHLARLARTREIFLDRLRSLPLTDWRTLRSPSDVEYDVTPEWAVFHLLEHEAGHCFQILALRKRAEQAIGSL